MDMDYTIISGKDFDATVQAVIDEAKTYDLVALLDVLEHVSGPGAFAQAAQETAPDPVAAAMLDQAGFTRTGREVSLTTPITEGQIRALKVGDVVIYKEWGKTSIKVDGEEYFIMSQNDILAVVQD